MAPQDITPIKFYIEINKEIGKVQMGEKSEDIYIKLRREYMSRMTKEEKEDEIREILMHDYMII